MASDFSFGAGNATDPEAVMAAYTIAVISASYTSRAKVGLVLGRIFSIGGAPGSPRRFHA